MERTDAARILQRMVAVTGRQIPREQAGEYLSLVIELPNYERANDALTMIVRDKTDNWMIPFGTLKETYDSETLRRKYSQPELREPDLTDEQRRENIRNAHALTELVSGHIDANEALQIVEGGADETEPLIADGVAYEVPRRDEPAQS